MAVELAKIALWLHTFTVGAPLTFLDHHLQLRRLAARRAAAARAARTCSALGVLFQQAELDRLERAARRPGRRWPTSPTSTSPKRSIQDAGRQRRRRSGAAARAARLLARAALAAARLAGGRASKLGKLGDEAMRPALAELLSRPRNLVAVLNAGQHRRRRARRRRANALLRRRRALARARRFFHWWTASPPSSAPTAAAASTP